MRLDVIIPTYNRCDMLEKTIQSLLRADCPDGLTVCITAVDNNSRDATKSVVERYTAQGVCKVQYTFESKQGRSHALNKGIEVTGGDLVGMIDDDEQIDAAWYKTIYSAFQDPTIDFIGGPYLPDWSADPPDWLPPDYLGVIGWVDGGSAVSVYGKDYPGILMGGNAVIRRSMLHKVGPYSGSLGRAGAKLLSCEDEDMHRRLLEAGANGLYLPSMIIYHYIPQERLSKRYFRRWCFWRGVSRGVLDKERPQPVAYLGGVPRYLYGRAARAVLRFPRMFPTQAAGNNPKARRFSDELAIWDLAGFFYGRHLYRQ